MYKTSCQSSKMKIDSNSLRRSVVAEECPPNSCEFIRSRDSKRGMKTGGSPNADKRIELPGTKINSDSQI